MPRHEYWYWESGDEGARAPAELYNLKRETGESKDVAAGNREIVARVEEILPAAYTPFTGKLTRNQYGE